MTATDPTLPRRRPRGRRATLAVALVCLVLSGAALAGAGGGMVQTFSDVPPSHPFYGEIENVARACIAEGYPDGTYRPNDNVNRGAMAAFLDRAGGRIGDSNQEGGPSPTVGSPLPNTMSAWTTIASGSIGLSHGNCDRTIKVDAHATVYTNQSVANTCHGNPCNVELGLFIGDQQVGSTFTRLNTDLAAESMAITGSRTIDDSTAIYTLRARAFNVKPGGAVFAARTVLGTYHPFLAPVPF